MLQIFTIDLVCHNVLTSFFPLLNSCYSFNFEILWIQWQCMLCSWLFVLAELILRISFISGIIRLQSMNRHFGTCRSSFKRFYKLENGFNNICDCISFSVILLTLAIINFKLLFYVLLIKHCLYLIYCVCSLFYY